jgi:diguanylate cyclase (GGDEF)-like protein/PAS domain S-box-containing protein
MAHAPARQRHPAIDGASVPGALPSAAPARIHADLHYVLDTVTDAYIVVDHDWRFEFLNSAAEQIFGRARETLLGQSVWELFPDAVNTPLYVACQHAMTAREPVALDWQVSSTGQWCDVRLLPTPTGLTAHFRDISERKAIEEQLRAAEARHRLLIEHIPAAIYLQAVDAEQTTLYLSPRIEAILGYPPQRWHDDPGFWDAITHPDDRARVQAEFAASQASGYFRAEFRQLAADGRYIWIRDETVLVRDDAGQPLCWQGYVADISERRAAEARMLESEARYRALVEQLPSATYMYVVRERAQTTYMSPQIERLTGFPAQAWLDDPAQWHAHIHPDDRAAIAAETERTDQTGEPYRVEYRLVTRAGDIVWVRDEADLARVDEDGAQHWHGVMTDITERKALEERIKHQAFHDALTGLPNRALLPLRIEAALADAHGAARLAVLFLDCDNFKYVNDSLGHAAGDDLLAQLARRLQGCARRGDTVARFGGDEFAILLTDLPNEGAAGLLAERVLNELAQPFVVAGRELRITASIGLVLAGARQESPDDLLRYADMAMYRAKAQGKNRYAIFDAAMHVAAASRLDLEGDLRRALEQAEFELHYQPVVNLASGAAVGLEALLRWNHPTQGLLAPSEFIPLAEETGLIVPLGRWALERACRQVAEWGRLQPHAAALNVSVNVSSRQFRGGGELLEHVMAALEHSGLAPGQLTLELTETAMLDDTLAAADTLARLDALGVRLALDDFGLGYSSLAHVKRFPLDLLKIDRQFVADAGRRRADTIILSGLIGLARALNLAVVAEGVETAAQAALLRELGCELGQGYYFARPMSAEAIAAHLAQSGQLALAGD